MRKKIDERIRTLIHNGVKACHRSMFVIIGDKSYDQVATLHYMLNNLVSKSRSDVLWCYKDKLELSSHKRKRAKQIKESIQRGHRDPAKTDDPYSSCVGTAKITYCLYRDSEKILGKTYGVCILQDFEALTPNLLARTIETVEGGGLILLLLRSVSTLASLYTMVMDVQERFRTESHSETRGRFNERFLLSLASCKACIVMDDELNILPISSHMKAITPNEARDGSEEFSGAVRDLKNLKDQLLDDFPVGPLIRKCCTMDQGKALVTLLDSILDNNLRSTIALVAGRGRGKSAALGLAIAGAVAAGYSNIFVTAPRPENLKTLFEFVCKGFDMLDYKDHLDYDVVKSNPSFKNTIVRINVFKQHRQTIQYIQPHEHEKLSQVELLVIDEAAAIPLPVVKSLLGPYLVFLSSTVNGYEGTGRSLSLKLFQQLEEQNHMPCISAETAVSGQLFKKIEMTESIRYASGDPIESWLHSLLCLDLTNSIPSLGRIPPASECDLYYVNRDTLFSYHKDSELFLQRMMALYVASHYKNSPNDLQLMADAPAHHLFVLLGPVDETKNHLPDILCVIQICFEGQISRKSAMKSLSEGHLPHGDQIPWKFCEQFGDTVFPSLSGARIVRIATHPSSTRSGYGSAAIQLLARYFNGQLTSMSEVDDEEPPESPQLGVIEAVTKASLLEENIKPRADLPPLLVPLCKRRPEKLHYLGVSFGLTLDLFRFWKKQNFAPFYISQILNSITGEHTCMCLKPLNSEDIEASSLDPVGFFSPCYQVFRMRLTRLLAQASFRQMDHKLAMSVLDPKIKFSEASHSSASSKSTLEIIETLSSMGMMGHLEAYTNNSADFHRIEAFVGDLARAYFCEKIPVSLSCGQVSVLLCVGLQGKDVSSIAKEMKLERSQILVYCKNIMTKFYKYLRGISSPPTEVNSTSRLKDIVLEPHPISVDEDLDDAAKQVKDEMKSKPDGPLNPDFLQQFAIVDKETEFDEALQNGGSKIVMSTISIKSKKRKEFEPPQPNSQKKRNKHDNSCSKSSKRREGWFDSLTSI